MAVSRETVQVGSSAWKAAILRGKAWNPVCLMKTLKSILKARRASDFLGRGNDQLWILKAVGEWQVGWEEAGIQVRPEQRQVFKQRVGCYARV